MIQLCSIRKRLFIFLKAFHGSALKTAWPARLASTDFVK